MEKPGPNPENENFLPKEEAHEIGLMTNEIIDSVAAVRAKYEQSDKVEQARAAVNIAADVIAPELETERREAKRAALTDKLTGLPNQASFIMAMESMQKTDKMNTIVLG